MLIESFVPEGRVTGVPYGSLAVCFMAPKSLLKLFKRRTRAEFLKELKHSMYSYAFFFDTGFRNCV